ncbi:FGGY family carbohydrate kinase, partial [Planococcus sp. MERTA32b]|nr:FGGY family carbohydrate kinase [Planococcus sp. MER TA 32b]
DLGTSGVKVALLNAQGEVAAIGSAPLQVSRPHALWSEQDPESWWLATDQAMQALAQQHALSEVKAIGLSGQMHGATLLDNAHRVLRAASGHFMERRAQRRTVPRAGAARARVAPDHRQPDDARLYRAQTAVGAAA